MMKNYCVIGGLRLFNWMSFIYKIINYIKIKNTFSFTIYQNEKLIKCVNEIEKKLIITFNTNVR